MPAADHEVVRVVATTKDNASAPVFVFLEGVDGRDYAYIGTFFYDWMKVWDVTNPSSPVLTDSIQLDARRINDVKIHPNNRLGIVTREGASSRRNGMVLLDLSELREGTGQCCMLLCIAQHGRTLGKRSCVSRQLCNIINDT